MKGTALKNIKRFLKNDAGITSTEYVLLAALIVSGIIFGVSNVGTSLAGFFETMATWIGSLSFGVS